MRRPRLLVLFALSVCLSGFAHAADTAPATRPAAVPDRLRRKLEVYDFSAATAVLQKAVADKKLSGVTLLVLKDDAVVYERSFGSFTHETVIPIASATKMPTVTAVMTLVDAKKIGLDDKVSKYLPDWPKELDAITVRHTLSNSTGLGPNADGLGFPALSRAGGPVPRDLAEAAARAAKAKPLGDPGNTFVYGNTGFTLAGRIAEVVSGKPWEEFFDDAVAKPLNLKTFSYIFPKRPLLGGSGRCDVEDYAKILLLHLNKGTINGRRILSEAAVTEMQKDQTSGKRIVLSPFPDHRPYGLSWWLTPPEKKGEAVNEVSDPGLFGTTPWLDTRRGYAAVLFMRENLRVATGLWGPVRAAINAELDKKKP